MIGAAAAGAIFGDNIGFWVGRTFGQRLVRGRAAGADLVACTIDLWLRWWADRYWSRKGARR